MNLLGNVSSRSVIARQASLPISITPEVVSWLPTVAPNG